MTASDIYDLVVLGAGPAGYAAAMRAHDLGKRVLLVERDRVGGRGIHEGALSSKTMWHLARDYACSCRSDRGFVARDVSLSYESVMQAVRAAVDERRSLLCRQLSALGEATDTGGRVELMRGTGRFISPHAIEVTRPDGSLTKVDGQHFLIATGSVPRIPDGMDCDGDLVVTSDHIEGWDAFPGSMVIVGAGVVGCEYATIFGHYGRTKLALIDRRPRILPFEDADIADCVAGSFERMGITIHKQAALDSLRIVDGGVEYQITDSDGSRTLRVERALISAGRIPNTSGLGLEAAGVKLSQRGSIVIDEALSPTRTNVPHIHAAGDTTADVALANVAELEGRHAAEEMFGASPHPIHYQALSAIMFLDPEVASVGLNETQARERGVPYRVAVVGNRLINRNLAMRNTEGFIKLLAARDGSNAILGLRVVGPQASTCIQGIAFLIDQGSTLDEIDYCVHPHPAVTEGVQECARLLLGRSLLKPSALDGELLRVAEG